MINHFCHGKFLAHQPYAFLYQYSTRYFKALPQFTQLYIHWGFLATNNWYLNSCFIETYNLQPYKIGITALILFFQRYPPFYQKLKKNNWIFIFFFTQKNNFNSRRKLQIICSKLWRVLSLLWIQMRDWNHCYHINS